MSLRGRVIGLIGLVLLVSLSIHTAISWHSARSDLAAELDAARSGGLRTVRSTFEDLPRSEHPARDLRQLLDTFDGNRHLQATVVDRFWRPRYSSRAAEPQAAPPRWFASLVAPDLGEITVAVPGASGDLLTLQPEPASDLAVLWSASVAAAQLFVVTVGLGLTLIYLVIGRALAPLADLSAGLKRIGDGVYREPIAVKGPPELLALQRGFNAMAERLAGTDARNRALEAQLLTIQDEERAEIARDLHDEIGPHLFAVALDADMIGRSVAVGETHVVPEQVRSIQSAVHYMQRQVRELIARLRPTRAAELGLEAALFDLVSFWKMRQPDVAFTDKIHGADAFVPELLRDVIYRVVQEAIANALKHAETTRLSISVLPFIGGVTVTVLNEGVARKSAQDSSGLGLISMRERVHAARGELKIQRAPQGWTIAARFATARDEIAAA